SSDLAAAAARLLRALAALGGPPRQHVRRRPHAGRTRLPQNRRRGVRTGDGTRRDAGGRLGAGNVPVDAPEDDRLAAGRHAAACGAADRRCHLHRHGPEEHAARPWRGACRSSGAPVVGLLRRSRVSPDASVRVLPCAGADDTGAFRPAAGGGGLAVPCDGQSGLRHYVQPRRGPSGRGTGRRRMTDVCAFVRRHLCTATVLILLAGLSLFAPTVHAADETGTRVLVMPFAADVAPDAPGGAGAALWLGEAAPTLLVEGLGTRGVGVMTRNERAAAFVRLNLPMSSALTRATTIRVGELIGASHIVFGEIRLGERMSVRARLVSLATGAEVATVEREGALEDI